MRGFSLIELSIVLVILGLLTGGILSGQSLIRAAELRSVSTELQKTSAAFYTFRDKYFGIPGDFIGATKFWGTASACPGDYTSPATDSKTCDGNASGIMNTLERYRAWQQLASAGLIEGSFTGVPNTSSVASLAASINVPKSRLSSGLYQVMYSTDPTGSTLFPQSSVHVLLFANISSPTLNGAQGVMRPEEAWNLDTKLDDGKPAYGRVMHYNSTDSTVGSCVTSSTASTAEYALTLNTIVCAPYFSMGF